MSGLTRQNLSSNSLFHFVNKMEYLLDILRNGFQARYCYEKFPKLNIPIAIPMKCFCDIPLGQIKYHISKYKGYGIGVSKSFARKNGITPVIYVHNNSKTLIDYLKEMQSSGVITDISILPYFKKYSGKENLSTVRYYDEKEWRFVPDDFSFLDLRRVKEVNRKNHVRRHNNKLNKTDYRLILSPNDIKYLFVEKKNDVNDLIIELKLIKSSIYTTNEIELLISKIITASQIIGDF